MLIAQDLKAALNSFDPERSLIDAASINAYFVARQDSPRADLAILLEDADTPQKILFTGHRGSGKSTELAKLVQGLGQQFFVVRFSVTQLSNLYDVGYVDVLLSLGLEMFKQTVTRHANVDDADLDTIRAKVPLSGGRILTG